MAVNETKIEYELGPLVYEGNPADKLALTIPDDQELDFAKIITQDGESYKLAIDFSLGGIYFASYSIPVEVSILQAGSLKTRNETVEVRFTVR